MARKISEIFDSIATSKDAMTELDGLLTNPADGNSTLDTSQKLLTDLTSTSKVAVWRLWMWITAVAIWSLENLWDLFKTELADLISRKDVATTRWYQAICLEFQYGDQLQWNGKRFIYAIIDATKQIIKKAAATEENGRLKIKVGKLSGSSIVPLSSPEQTAFTAYIRLRKIAGTFISIISMNADSLWIGAKVVYDATVLDASGQSLASPGTYPVEDAINAYVSELNNDFNGKFFNSELVMNIKQCPAVVDVTDIVVKVKNVVDNTWITVNSSIVAYSGHFKIDPSYALNTTLIYAADV